MPAFSKAAGCRAEPYGLNRRSRRKKCSGRGARCEADSPGSGRGGTVLAPSTSKTPGRGGTPRGGHPSPLFLKYGKAGAAPLATPEGPGVSPQTPPPLKRWTKLLLVSTQLAWRDPPLRNARRRLVLSGHGPRARGRYVPVGRCPAAGLRCHFGRCWASATGRQHPSRQARQKPASLRKPRRPKAACAT